IGFYGMMASSVARGSNEVGIRMALGADRRRIVGAVVRETMTLVGAGVVVGMGAAWAATRLIAGTLFGLSAMDPPTLAFAIAVMTVVALAAGYVPARRAAPPSRSALRWTTLAWLANRSSRSLSSVSEGWWRGTESNCRHYDFQSYALPTELPRHSGTITVGELVSW